MCGAGGSTSCVRPRGSGDPGTKHFCVLKSRVPASAGTNGAWGAVWQNETNCGADGKTKPKSETKRWLHLPPRRAKQCLELAPQDHVDLRHGHRHAEIDEARHAIALLGHPARYDALEMRKLGLHIERHAVQ